MSFRQEAVNGGVSKLFDVVDPVKLARSQIIRLAGTVLLAYAAITVPSEVLGWLLIAWVAYRVYQSMVLLFFGNAAHVERERRLRAIPPHVWAFLKSGQWSEGSQ